MNPGFIKCYWQLIIIFDTPLHNIEAELTRPETIICLSSFEYSALIVWSFLNIQYRQVFIIRLIDSLIATLYLGFG